MRNPLRAPARPIALAFLALLVAAAATAVALPGKNTVDTGDIKKNAVGSSDVKSNSLTGSVVIESNTVRCRGPRRSITGNSANTANSANTVDTATIAGDAAKLGDRFAGDYATLLGELEAAFLDDDGAISRTR